MIRRLLLLLSGVTEKASRFGPGSGFFRGRREFAHFHSATEIDLRLTRRVIRTLPKDWRLVRRKTASDWIAFKVRRRSDARVACALARLAWELARS